MINEKVNPQRQQIIITKTGNQKNQQEIERGN